MGLFGEKSQTEFYRAVTISGHDAGLGARCPVCSGCVRYGLYAGDTFEHCGHKEAVPTDDWHKLPARSLKRGLPELPRGYIMVDTWDSNDGLDWEAESNAKSFDPDAYVVSWV